MKPTGNRLTVENLGGYVDPSIDLFIYLYIYKCFRWLNIIAGKNYIQRIHEKT